MQLQQLQRSSSGLVAIGVFTAEECPSVSALVCANAVRARCGNQIKPFARTKYLRERHLGERPVALLKGTLDVLVLKTLSWGPMHGFEITRWLETRSNGRLDITDAALLQALHRLEERELLLGEWGITKNERRARYYRLTSAGRTQLRAETAALVDQFDALMSVLNAKSA